MAINGVFLSIALIFILATLGAFIARFFKQPLIPAYILTGMIIGPGILGLIQDVELIHLLAEIGIAFLLFIVGLELDVTKIKSTGFVSSAGGMLQMIALFATGWIAAIFMDFSTMESIYLAIVLMLSSTFVVVKLLSDQKELLSLHGRIAIGFLLFQDIVAILILSLLGTVEQITGAFIFLALLKGLLLLCVGYLCSSLLFPSLFKFTARSKELLFLLSLTVLFVFSLFALSLGFSIAIGAFLAGIALANLPYNYEIGARIKPLRDFFATLFFVALGMEFTTFVLSDIWIPFVVLTALTIFWKPFVTFITCVMFGYAGRTSFQVAGSLAQVSEFSLIIAAQGLVLGHVSEQTYGLIIMVTMFSIAVSTYYVHYDAKMAFSLRHTLHWFAQFGRTQRKGVVHPTKSFEIILIGCNRIGHGIIQAIKKKNRLLVIDYNPDIIAQLQKQGITCMYGDISDFEILDDLDFSKTKMIVSTVGELDSNMLLLHHVKKRNKNTVIFVTGNMIEDSLQLYEAGADYVILPHFLGGNHVSLLLNESMKDFQQILTRRLSHIKELKHRLHIGQSHPEH